MPSVNQSNGSTSSASNLLRFSFFNATTWMIGLGTPLILLAGELGASSFEVGLIYAFVFLMLPVQVIATSTLPRFGYKKQLIFGWATRGAFLFIPLFLASLAPDQPERWMVLALITSTFLFAFFRAIGGCAVMPLIYAVIPEDRRSGYFSRDQAVTATSGILTLLLCALLFRYLPAYKAFFWQYTYAIVGVALTLLFISRVKDPPKPEQTSLQEIAAETPRVCLRPSPFRQYLVFMGTAALAGPAFVPLQAYFLKVEIDLGMDRILAYTAIQNMGAIFGAFALRKLMDGVGVKPVFRLALALGCFTSVYWFFLVRGSDLLVQLLPAAYFIFGLQSSQWMIAHLRYLPRVCDENKQALHVSLHSSVIGLVAGLSPMAWGFWVKVQGSAPGINTSRFAIFFILLFAIHLVLFTFVPYLTSDHRQRPPIQSGATLLRPFRSVGNLINLIPHRPSLPVVLKKRKSPSGNGPKPPSKQGEKG